MNFQLLVIVIALLAFVSNAQTAKTSLGAIDVPLSIGGATFSLNFQPEIDSSESVARKLCIEQGASFGITEETLVNGCIVPVKTYLDSSIQSWLDEKTLEVPMTISDQTFSVRFLPERDSVSMMSQKVCNEQSKLIGVPPDSKACIEPMENFLFSSVERWIDDKTLDTQISINGKSFDIRFLPERESSANLAKNLCIREAEAIGGLTDENVVDVCIRPVANFIGQQIQTWLNEKTFSTTLALNEKNFDVSFMPSRESAAKISRILCIQQAEAIGGLTNENIGAACITPVTQELSSRVQAWIRDKTVALTLNLNQAEINISFMPSRQSTISMARKVCVENADRIGGLTNENVVQTCVNPVTAYLNERVQEWVASKAN